ncbi:MAG: thioredoxin domain-containing protein [Acidimicrobiia bacterium]
MPNQLANATSPYLLQHKDNPVDWHQWGDEAFAEAARRDVPVLLSVGYSACHWCHVMAHESFEDPDTARLMNRLFVNVKVDREERPDVDSVYMEAVQAMTGRGGWPMTVWLTPDRAPFYAGTYFPSEEGRGMPSFTRVMEAVSEAWEDRREEVLGQSARLVRAITSALPVPDDLPGESVLAKSHSQTLQSFDPINGGFGAAPKFPQEPVLELLLRTRGETWAEKADEMVGLTLLRMADGGIHDHLGGGFARYSVDERWLVPHFEKMLYDNAQLARLYLWAGIELREPRFLDVTRSTLAYLLNDLHAAGGGFFSAEDADSEGVEGKFYVWSRSEFDEVVGESDGTAAAEFFGVTAGGNFEGQNILHRPTGRDWDDRIESIRRRLLERRNQRVRPGLDDKVIASWNGLAIRALAEAGVALDEPAYLGAAIRCAEFITTQMTDNGTLQRSWRDGINSGPGYLEDHASMALGLFSLHAATADKAWLDMASELVHALTERFADPEGGFFDTAEDTTLMKRPKSQTDNPLPSGNAMAAEALLAMFAHTGEAHWLEASLGALRSAGLLMERYPSMVAHHLSVLHAHQTMRELAIIGPDWSDMARVYWSRFRPGTFMFASPQQSDEIPLLANRGRPGETLAFLCRSQVCDLPATSPPQLEEQLSGG